MNAPRLRDDLLRGRLLPFVGAGVSKAVKRRTPPDQPLFPDLPELVRRLASHVEANDKRDVAAEVERRGGKGDYLGAADAARAAMTPHEWALFLREQFIRDERDATDSSLSLARTIWRLGSPVVITTNYDDVLSWACPDGVPDRWLSNAPEELQQLADGSVARPTVWHLHGHISQVSSLVLTTAEFESLYGDDPAAAHCLRAAREYLKNAYVGRRLLFVGYSLKDPYVLNELERWVALFEGVTSEPVVLLPPSDREREAELARLHVRAEFRDYDDQPRWLESLAAVAARGSGWRPNPRTPAGVGDGPFLGREEDVSEVADLVLDQRLVVITGPGGIGKTRLSIEVIERLRPRFAGRRFSADLTEVRAPEHLARAIAQALDAELTGRDGPIATIATMLAQRGRQLVVLDNAEHCLGIVREALRVWRDEAPQTHFLVTSRVALQMDESRHRLAKLRYPRGRARDELTVAAAADYSAVALFLALARSDGEGQRLPLDDEYVRSVADVCAQVDGLPLALKLAARLVSALPPEALLDKLRKSKLELLRSTTLTDAKHHTSLETAIASSFEDSSLDATLQDAALRCSVFRGGFLFEAAKAVLGPEATESETVRLLEELVERSLLEPAHSDAHGQPRYWQLVPIREFTSARWEASRPVVERARVEQAHADHYLEYAETWAALVRSPNGPAALDRLEAELDNLMAIKERATIAHRGEEAARAVVALTPLFELRGRRVEHAEHLRGALAMLGSAVTPVRARVLSALALAGDPKDGGVEAANFAVELAKEHGWVPEHAEGLLSLANLLCVKAEFEDAQDVAEVAARLFRDRLDDRIGEARAMRIRATALYQISPKQNLTFVIDTCDQLVAVAEDAGDLWLEASSLLLRGGALGFNGEFDEAMDDLCEAEQALSSLRASRLELQPLHVRAAVALFDRRYPEAIDLYERLQAKALDCGDRWEYGQVLTNHVAAIYRADGDVREALKLNRRAAKIADGFGNNAALAVTQSNEAALRLRLAAGSPASRQRHSARALNEANASRELFERCHMANTELYWHSVAVSARAAEASGDAVTARAHAVEALALADELGLADHWDAYVQENMREILRIAGRPAPASDAEHPRPPAGVEFAQLA